MFNTKNAHRQEYNEDYSIILIELQLLKGPPSFSSHLCLLWSLWFLFLPLSHSFLHSHGLQRYLKQENAYEGWKWEWGLRGEQSSHVRKSKTVLDSGLHAVDSGLIPLFVRETYIFLIPILSRISDSLSGIPYSKAQNSGSHKPNCSWFSDSKIKRTKTSRIPEFGWGENSLLPFCESVLFTWDEKNCDLEPKLKVMNESFKPDLSLTFLFSGKIPCLHQIPNTACHNHQHNKTSRNVHDDAGYFSMV